jgi:hypothetical protein
MSSFAQHSHLHFISGGRLVEDPLIPPTEDDLSLRTWADEYVAPVRYKVEIYDPTGVDPPLLTFDPFAENNPFVLTGVDITNAPGQTGTFNIVVDDSEQGAIDERYIHNGCVIRIQGSKDGITYKNRAWGISYKMLPVRPDTGLLEYTFQGNGFGAIFNYTLTNFIKSAKRIEPGSTTPDPTDPTMTIFNLVLDLLTKKEILISDNGYSIAESYDLDVSEVEGRLLEVLPGITLPRTIASAVIEQLMASSGGIFWVNPDKKVKAQYPSEEHSGITIKDWISDEDRGEVISYPMASWSSDYSITPGEFANEVVLDVNLPQQPPIAQSPDVKSYETLAGKDLMVQFIPGAARLTNLGLTMSKTGTGHDGADDAMGKTGVQGLIVADNGSNQPSTNIIATLNIPYEDISTNQSTVYKLNLNFETDNIDPAKKHWLILRRSGNTEESTIQWYHDNDDETPSTDITPRRIGIKTPPSLETFIKYKTSGFEKGWATSNDGPVFSFSFFANALVTLIMQNPESVSRYTPRRPIQTLLFAPWITDAVTGLLYMTAVLNRISREKRIFTMNEVTIPNKQFDAGLLCTLNDNLQKLNNQLVEIAGVHESASAQNLFDPLGRNTCDVSLIQHLDPLQFEEMDDIIAPCVSSGGSPGTIHVTPSSSIGRGRKLGQQSHRHMRGG